MTAFSPFGVSYSLSYLLQIQLSTCLDFSPFFSTFKRTGEAGWSEYRDEGVQFRQHGQTRAA